MKFSTVLAASFALITAVSSAPIDTEDALSDFAIDVPEEALIGFIDLTGEDITVLPVANGTQSGILFINTTIASEAFASTSGDKTKRQASPWSWIRLSRGQPLFKREAEAEASPWSWIRLSRGQPLFKREAEAEAEALPWSWIRLSRGQPLF